jgi:hypothetical protein
MVRTYIRHQEEVDERYDQMKLVGRSATALGGSWRFKRL